MRIGYIFRYLFIYLLLNDGEKFVISSDQETSLKGSSQSNGSFSADSSGSVAIPSEVGLFTTDGSGNYVNLEQSKVKVVQDGVEYSFEFDSDVQLTKVEHNSSKVWEHKENKPYPKSVAYKSDETLFAIISDTEIVNCKFENNQWKFQIDVLSQSSPKTSVTNVELNLSASAGTNQFEYNRTGDTAEFKAKAGHEFTAVIGTSGTDGVSGRVIWKPMNPNENATRVVLGGVDKNDKKLTIHKKNNEKVEFTKSSTNHNWEEVVTKVELELSITSSTNEFDYDKKNELTSFIAKDGYGFTKVLKAKATDFSREEQVWEADTSSNNFAKLVRLKLNDNHIVLILNNAEFILFHKVAEDQDWKDITNDRHKLSELKFFTFDQSKSLKELDSTYYKVELNGFSYGYTFKDDFELQQIKYQNKLVYNYHSDEDFGLLKGLYLGLSSNKFFITNYDDESKELDVSKEVVIKREAPPAEPAKPAEPKPKPKPEPAKEPAAVPEPENTIEPVSVTIPTLSPVELKINKSSAENEFDYDDIGVYKTFSCRQGFGFNKIVNPKTFGADEVIWQSSGNDYATKVRFKETSGTKEKQILLFLASMKYVFLHSDKGKPFQNVTSDRHKFYNLKVYTLQNDVEKIAKPDQYTISLYHMSIGCTIKNEYPCSKIIYEDKVVYKKDDYQDLGQIKGVYLDLIRNSMYVIGINDQTKVLEAMKTAKEFTLNIRKDESTDEFDFIQDYQKNVRIFTARGNAVFTKVIRGVRIGSDELIWESKDIKVYGTKVVTDGLSDFKRAKNVTIHLSNGDVKHLNYSDGKWIQASNKISLDITKTESSIEFDFYTKDEFTTFTAKDVYLFNKVIESKTIGTETVIWETTNTSEYSKKVTLMVTGDEKYMGLLRTDDDVILLHKPPNSDTWDNITSKVTKISELKMSYYDPSGSYFMLKPEKYKVAFNNLLYGYEFNSGVDCHLVKFGDKLLWSHSDDKFKNIKGVYVYLRNNNFFVVGPSGEKKEITLRSLSSGKDEEDEDDGDKETKLKEDDQTKEDDKSKEDQDQDESSESSTSVTLVELDITKTETTNEYDYEEKDDNHVFKAKTGFKFSKVKKGTHELKDLSSPHSIKITANYNQAGKILLYVYRTNKDFEFSLVNDPDPSSSQASVPSESGTLLAGQSKIVSDQFKLLTEDDSGTSQEFDKQKLTTEQQLESHLINYKFPHNAKCSEVTYKNATVWKHDESIHGKNYLTNVFLNTNTSFLMVESQGRYQYYFTLLNDEWKCISGYRSHALKPLSLDSLKIFTLNQFGLISADDDTQFTKKVDGSVITFKFKTGAKCVSVKYRGDELWSHNNKDHEEHYPDTIIVNTNQEFLTLESTNVYRYVFSHYDGKFTCIFAYKSSLSQPIEKGKLKLSKVGKLGLMEPIVSSDYEVKESDTEYKFKFNDVICKKIMYGEEVVWKHTDDANFSTIRKFRLGLVTNNFCVTNSNDETKQLDIKVTLNLNALQKSETTDKFVHTDENGVVTYRPKSGCILTKVTEGPKDVWTASGTECATQVRIRSDDQKKYLAILLGDGNFKFFQKESDNWSEISDDNLLKDHTPNFPAAKSQTQTSSTKPVAKPAVTSATKVTLDISKTQSTNEFDFTDQNGVVTYTPKDDHLFSKVSQGTTDIWESKNNVYGTLLMIKSENNVKYLSMLMTNKMFKLFKLENNEWQDITSDRLDITKLKFLGEGDTELSKTDYTVSIVENSYEFKFTSDPKCTCIKYNDTEVWKHSSQHGDKFPTSVSFNNLNRNYLVVESSRSYRKIFQFENNEFKSLGANQKLNHDHNSTGVFDPSKLKFMTTDQDTSKLVELTLSQYTVQQPTLITYKFNDSVKCAEVRYDDLLVWKYLSTDHEEEFPTAVVLNRAKNYIFVESSHYYRYVYSYYNRRWKELPFGFKTLNIFFDKFKMLTKAPTDSNKLVELDYSKFERVYSSNVVTVNFTSDVKCTCIKYDNKDVWQYNYDEHKDKFPTSLVLNKKKKFFIVESGYEYRYVYSLQNNIWKLLPYGYKLSESTKMRPADPTKIKLFTMDNNTTVQLNELKYQKEESNDLFLIKFNPDANCKSIKYDNTTVWSYDVEEHKDRHPTTLVLNKKKYYITVQSGYDYRYSYLFYNRKWNLLPVSYNHIRSFDQVDPSKLKIFHLNQNNIVEEITSFPTNEQGESSKSPSSNDDKGDTSEKSDTNEQGESGDKIATSEQDESSASADSTEQSSSSNGVSSDDSVSIYNIPENMKCVLVKYDDIEVWRYSDIEHQDKYPTRVLLYKNNATLIVESSSNYEYVYTYEDKIWKLTPFGARLKVIESNYDLDKLKLHSVDTDNQQFVLENINHYNLQQSGKLARYTMNQGVKCTEVLYDDKTVWKYNEDEHGGYFPTNVTMNLNTGFITVESKGLYESYFSYYDNKWNLVYGYKASFRIKFKESAKLKFYITNDDGLSEPTTHFDKEVTGPVITYNMFYGTKCTHVKYDEVSVWTYDSDKHGDHYPTSVFFNISKMLITVQSSDQYAQFLTLINEEWKPFSGYRSQASGPSEIKIYKKGRSGDQVFVHSSRYTVKFDENTNEYVYNLEKANCNEIRHNGNPVFKLDQNERYPKEVLCSSDVKKITVKLKESYHVCTMDSNGWKTMIHKTDGTDPKAGPEYPFVTSSKPAVPTSEAATETQSPESDTSQSASSASGTTSEDFDLSQALDPSQKGSQVSTTPKSQSASSESGTTSEEFDLSQALDSSQTSSQVSTTPPTESQPPSSPTSSSTAGLDSDPTSGTFME
ncbi:SfiI-subtelomeric fragment related protein family member, putative [Theileria annulata]|uniref:SfiI-subtelomeric related protein family member, putative n=1 Tax=Theileria annulata TaxID=5874 RepID=Q4UGJ7_THEAN|nr:SfiI-subtelomeric fragment related protein family member, putative [Theileria annulata]CAI73792.1 SfiI-subtelomeric fragment related protein family member, putative [Theileria annulata]